MSITGFINGRNYQKIRDRLKEDFPRPKVKLDALMIASPQTKNYAIIGAAFDYLLRLKIKYSNQESKIIERDDLIGNKAIEGLQAKFKKRPVKKKIKKSENGFFWEAQKLSNNFMHQQNVEMYDNFKKAEPEILIAREVIASLSTDFDLHDDILKACIIYAKLDLYFRAFRLDSEFSIIDNKDLEDLRNLAKIIPNAILNIENICYLNPSFRLGNEKMTAPGDGDLIIDNCLIDIKTTKNLKITRAMINQLVCYYAAIRKNGINQNRELTTGIDKIGIYFSRHGYLWTVPVDLIGEDQNFLSFNNWFGDFMHSFDITKKP